MTIDAILSVGKPEGLLAAVLLQVGVILLVARAFAMLFRWMRQPSVVGEIVAGLVLGPSVLGKLEAAGWLPAISKKIFDPGAAGVMEVMAQIGLVLLLFLIGLEFDFGHLRARGKSAVAVSSAGVALPFALGFGIGWGCYDLVGSGGTRAAFALFMGTAMSITALPILGRMLMEMGLTRTKLATMVITAAAIDDAMGWILLAAVTTLVSGQVETGSSGHAALMQSARMAVETAAFGLVMYFGLRPWVGRWLMWVMARNRGGLGMNGLALLIVLLFVCALATSEIGIFAIFGAFLLGACLSGVPGVREAVQRELGLFVMVFFLPIFFTYTGLRTDIGSLGGGALWIMAAAVMAAAILGKLGGCGIMAKLAGHSWRESCCVGLMMNTRALMELVVINVGYNLGIIPKSVFCMLVMMAVGTTVMTTPLLQWVVRGTELEAGMTERGFLKEEPAGGVAVA